MIFAIASPCRVLCTCDKPCNSDLHALWFFFSKALLSCLTWKQVYSKIYSFFKPPFKAEHYSSKLLPIMFPFHRRFPYNPYISRIPLNSSKYMYMYYEYAVKFLPLWTSILHRHMTRSRWVIISKPEEYKHLT